MILKFRMCAVSMNNGCRTTYINRSQSAFHFPTRPRAIQHQPLQPKRSRPGQKERRMWVQTLPKSSKDVACFSPFQEEAAARSSCGSRVRNSRWGTSPHRSSPYCGTINEPIRYVAAPELLPCLKGCPLVAVRKMSLYVPKSGWLSPSVAIRPRAP